MRYVCGLFSLFLLSGCSSYENDNIDTEGMKISNKLLIPPVISKSSSSIGKGHNVKQYFDREAQREISLPDANTNI